MPHYSVPSACLSGMEPQNLLRPRFILAETVVLIVGVLLFVGVVPVEVGIGFLGSVLAAFQAYPKTPNL